MEWWWHLMPWTRNCTCFVKVTKRACLSMAQLTWHVWIIQTEFPGHIRNEHLEGVKWECFHEGLKGEYQVMLAHKMEDEYPATYAKLLKAVSQIKNHPRLGNLHHHILSWREHVVWGTLHPLSCFPHANWRGVTQKSLTELLQYKMMKTEMLEMTHEKMVVLMQKRQSLWWPKPQ